LEIHRESASARSVKEAMEDQARLVDLVRAYRSISSADVLLLDAHSIIAIGSEHHVIPVGTIRSMKPEGLIFVEASAEAILKRRFSRGDTVDIGAETEDVTRLQAASLKAVKGYSLALNCQLIIVPADQGVDLTEAIANLQ
jgi:adenylate kinase